jgi:hypothetical protein
MIIRLILKMHISSCLKLWDMVNRIFVKIPASISSIALKGLQLILAVFLFALNCETNFFFYEIARVAYKHYQVAFGQQSIYWQPAQRHQYRLIKLASVLHYNCCLLTDTSTRVSLVC